MPTYYETIRQILTSLELAILEAKSELPEHLRWEHSRILRSRQVVDAWREVQEQYLSRNQEPDRTIERTLDTLCLLIECKNRLAGLLQDPGDLPPPNLRLVKMK